MKKFNILFIVALATTFVFTSCTKNKVQLPALNTQSDSLNYAFGLANGHGIRQYYMRKDTATTADSTQQKIASLLKGIEDGMKSGADAKYAKLEDLGKNIGNALKTQSKAGLMGDSALVVNMKLIKQGLVNGLKGSAIKMNASEAQMYLQTTMHKRRLVKLEKEFGPNKIAGEKFLAANKTKPGVITTASGLQYKVIRKGHGPMPTDTSRVKVNYEGRLIDGTVFDSSYKRKAPATFRLNQVIKGWGEALKLMPVGSEYEIYIPEELAYGSNQQGMIKPFSALVFKVELLAIVK